MKKKTQYSREDINQHLSAFELSSWQDVENKKITPQRAQFYLQNVTQLFPHAIVHRDGAIASLVGERRTDVANVSVEIDGTQVTLEDFVQGGAVDGVIALHKGRIVYERYPGMRSFDKHLWWSVTKAFTGTLIGLLEERGALDINAPIDSYLPELAGSGYHGVPVRDVVDMASGIDALEMDDPDAYDNPDAPYAHFEGALKMLPCTNPPASPHEALSSFASRDLPGKAFMYSSVDTFACSWLIERLMGAPFHEIVRAEFWSKIGPEADAYMLTGPDGASASHGGFSSTLRDLARFGLLYTPSWNVVSKEKVISDEHIRKITSEARPHMFLKGLAGKFWQDVVGEELSHNIYQWDFVTKEGDFFKAGWGSQGLYISPSRDVVFAFFCHQNSGAPLTKFARYCALLLGE